MSSSKITINTHIGGSRCTIFGPGFYIDDRIDVRNPTFSFIEVVRKGHITKMYTEYVTNAPEKLLQILKNELYCG